MKKLLISLLIAAAPLPALAEECRTYRSPPNLEGYENDVLTLTVDGIDDHFTFDKGFQRMDLVQWDCAGLDVTCYGPPDTEIFFVVKNPSNERATVVYVDSDGAAHEWKAACDRR